MSTLDAETKHKYRHLIDLFIFSAVIFILGVMYSVLNPYMGFDRTLIQHGEVWRILSCNLVHLNVNHMLLNLSVYVLISLLFKSSIPMRQWYTCLIICGLSVGLGLYFLDPGLHRYVGLSGVLYGLLAFGLLLNLKENIYVYLAVYAIASYKVISQQFDSFDDQQMKEFIGGSVIASSHLYGLIAGNVFAFILIAIRIQKDKGALPAESNDYK